MKKNSMIYLLTIPAIAAAALGLILCVTLANRGGPSGVTDDTGRVVPGSISEKVFARIGGVRQGMYIRSRDTANPVLLFIHGGPGFPNYFLFEKYKPGLEELFTVCYWEQRGGGLSWKAGMAPGSVTPERLAGDLLEVAGYLRSRFGKDKIYLMAHSGGTTIALPAVAKAPEQFHAYIAIAQITRQDVSERIAYEWMKERFAEMNDKRSLRQMEAYNDLATDSDLLAFFNSGFRDNAMHRLGIGTMREMRSVIGGIFIPSLTCRAYTIGEKVRLWRSKFIFLPQTNLRRESLFTDFGAAFPVLELPVCFVCGKHDLTVNSDLTREYYDRVEAPLKRWYLFENSAHSPVFEEPERFRQMLREIIGDTLHEDK